MLLDDVLARVRSGTTKDDDARWLAGHIADLERQADLHRRDNELMLHVLAKERRVVVALREENARLRRHLNLRQRPDSYYPPDEEADDA